MMCLDIYLSDQRKEANKDKMGKTPPSNQSPMPLLCWDIFIENYHHRLIEAKKLTEMKQVIAFAEKFGWQNDVRAAFSENEYEALIITDVDRKIIWVNEGFSEMTGYSKRFAMAKTPHFLQGKETSPSTKARIKEKILKNKPFKEVIVNYKKDKTTYRCEVKIIPLYSEKTTHYIAFEKQIVG